ncbi:hypothetical protein OAL95_01245 [Alphaproteobacteria bacterium]|nr:hypothetical protein [Alphaproteobacteria bacterium]
MPFKLHPEAEYYFKNIKIKKTSKVNSAESISTLWDMYYLCLIIGMKIDDSLDPDLQEKIKSNQVFIKKYVKEYENIKFIIISLLIKAESKKLGIDMSEKEHVIKLIENNTSAEYPYISALGANSLNQYHYLGFEHLKNYIDKPVTEALFWKNYLNLIKELD